MHKSLDNYLCKKYPKIFCDRNKSPQKTCMCWGFPNNGWFYLIENLCKNIQRHINQREEGIENKWEWALKEGKIDQVIALQVKEKFSALCFYYSGGDKYIRGMVDLTESLSARVCETCGRMDHEVSRNKKGWIHTTCPDHTETIDLKDHLANQAYDKELFDIWQGIKKENINVK